MSYRRKSTFPYPSGRVMHIDPQQVRNTYSCTPIHLSHDVLFKRSQIRIHTCWDTFIMKKQIDLIQGQAYLENLNWWLGISMSVSIQKVIGKMYSKYKMYLTFFSVFNNREQFVTLLEKHIQIDIYGKCGTLKCTPPNVNIT